MLVIEDDDKIAFFIVNGPKQAGFATDHAANDEDGPHLASTERHDAAIVGLMLHRLRHARWVRQVKSLTPCVRST
jgi:two-component system, OmpR family, response regulator